MPVLKYDVKLRKQLVLKEDAEVMEGDVPLGEVAVVLVVGRTIDCKEDLDSQ